MNKLIGLLCVIACSVPSTFAQSVNALDQLKAGDFKLVEDSFSALQSEFEQGLKTEYDLFDAYKVFYQRDDVFRPQLNQWIERYPKSSSAYLARGIYFRKLGEFRRGSDYVDKVKNENMEYMEEMFELAKKDLRTSLRIDQKSYLAVLHLLNIAQFEGDDRAAREYLVLGSTAYPGNFLVRARYLIHLTPKWGGSYTAMDTFIESCRSQGMPPDKINLLSAIKFDDQGHSAQEQGQTEQARSAYANALALSRSSGPRFRQDYLQYSLQICREPQNSSKEYCR